MHAENADDAMRAVPEIHSLRALSRPSWSLPHTSSSQSSITLSVCPAPLCSCAGAGRKPGAPARTCCEMHLAEAEELRIQTRIKMEEASRACRAGASIRTQVRREREKDTAEGTSKPKDKTHIVATADSQIKGGFPARSALAPTTAKKTKTTATRKIEDSASYTTCCS